MDVSVLEMTAEAVILSAGSSIPAQYTCRQRCRDGADLEPIKKNRLTDEAIIPIARQLPELETLDVTGIF